MTTERKNVTITLDSEDWNYICLVHRDMADALERNEIRISNEEPGTREGLVQQSREMADRLQKLAFSK